jgi:uncharacterized SAM-binding protein YcdF (DUF218 family)
VAVSLYLSKLLSLFLHPLTLGLLLGGVGVGVGVAWRRRAGLAVVALGLLVVWVPATPWVADGLLGTLERPFPPAPAAAAPTADAIVVLGGAVGLPRPPRVYPDLHGASDRVWHAARLYEAGKAPLVIASGGTLPWRDRTYREAAAMRSLLVSWGVPADAIVAEDASANTYQNAQRTAEIVRARGLDRVLLVTSAFHMRRALATFRSAGVETVPAATDYRVVEQTTTLLSLFPSVEALGSSTTALREYAGYLVYRWRGWIENAPAAGA